MNSENVKLAKSFRYGEKKMKQVITHQYERYDRGFTTFYDFMQALLDHPEEFPKTTQERMSVAEARKILEEERR